MRYFILIFALVLPLSAQTEEIDRFEAEVKALQHLIQKAKAAHNFTSVTLDSALIVLGYSISADTTDAEYVVFTMPDSLAREAVLTIREMKRIDRMGIPFVKTSDAKVIRVHRRRLPLIVQALKP